MVLFFFFKHFRGPLFFHRRFLHFAFFLRPAFLLFKLFSEVVATSFPLFALGFFFFLPTNCFRSFGNVDRKLGLADGTSECD